MTELIIEPLEIERNETVAVSVSVTNSGNSSGQYTVELELDYELIDSENVTLGAQESTTVSFTLSTDEVGNHIIETGNLFETFKVGEIKGGSFKIPWVVVDFSIIVVTIAAVYYLRKGNII